LSNYFIRRILLIIPTLIGITLITFLILQAVPGGPLESQLMKLRFGNSGTGEISNSTSESKVTNIPESAIKELKEFYGFDKPLLTRYFIWLKNVFMFDFGKSYVHSEPVIKVITDRFPVSLYFGLTGFILTYLVCVPLGIIKAVRNGSKFDFISSFVVFLGYSTPGWAFGILMLILFGGGSFWDVFPLGGFHYPNFESLSFFNKISDIIYHTFLPVLSYMIGSFATLTILTKNAVLENLGRDYVRTAYAKGLSGKRILYIHVLRNSLLPVVTGLGQFFSVILAGSILIEKVFNIQGIGMLTYNSVIERDYPVVMGLIVFQALLLLAGNLLTDFLYAYVDPRIRYK
jgi:microcin C transport system permease protein